MLIRLIFVLFLLGISTGGLAAGESVDATPNADQDTIMTIGETTGSAQGGQNGSDDPATGGLRIVSVPDSAVVSVNDSVQGLSPLELSGLAPGQYIIKIMKKGFYIKKATVSITAGVTREVSVNLTRPARLVVNSRPVGALLSVNGAAVGTTPYENVSMKPGTYVLELSLNGYQSLQETVQVEDGAIDTLDFTLQPRQTAPLPSPGPEPAVPASAPAPSDESRRSLVNKISLGVFVVFTLAILIIELASSK